MGVAGGRSWCFEVHVDGCRGADAPATYAQRAMWWATNWMADAGYFNLGWILPVPDGVTVDDVADALRRLIGRFDTLRTLFEDRDDGLHQMVATAVSLPVEVHDCPYGSAEKTGATVLASVVGPGFRSEAEWPIRVAVVTEDGSTRLLVIAMNHLAVDMRGWRVIERTLTQLLADPAAALDEPGWQPVDVAAYEGSAEGRAANRAALERWEAILTGGSPTLFDFDPVEEERDRFWQLRMESRALAVALAVVAERCRTSDAAVLLAAVSTVLGHYSGHDDVVLQVNVANRIVEGTENIAGYLCWDSLFYLEFCGLSFDAICRRSFSAALETYRNGMYDRAAAAAIREAVELERGAKIDLGCYVNDCREGTSQKAAHGLGTAPDLDALRADTRTWFVRSHPRVDTRFYVDAYDAEDSVALELMCDTRYVPVRDIDEILRATERLLIAAAGRDLEPEAIGGAVGLAGATRRAGWIRYERGWVHLPSARRVWSEVAGPSAALFASTSADGATRLTGYGVGSPGGDGVRGLHAAFVKALGDRSDVRAPDLYICCSDAPAEIEDQAAWQRCAVVEAGTGRERIPTPVARIADQASGRRL